MIIGLTGGIGSGKSTVAKLFEIMGCVIYHSDDVAKQLYTEPNIRKRIVHLLGTSAYVNETEINKPFIAQQVFSNTLLLHQLNAIIHPAVKDHFRQFITTHPDQLIVKETALLFETNNQQEFDYSILITSPANVKIERVMKRSGFTKTEIETRMQHQWEDAKKLPLADFVIVNDNVSPLIPQVISIFQEIQQHQQRPSSH